MTSPHHDLAAALTAAVKEIVATAAPAEVWTHVEADLREQIDQLKHEIAAERSCPDA